MQSGRGSATLETFATTAISEAQTGLQVEAKAGVQVQPSSKVQTGLQVPADVQVQPGSEAQAGLQQENLAGAARFRGASRCAGANKCAGAARFRGASRFAAAGVQVQPRSEAQAGVQVPNKCTGAARFRGASRFAGRRAGAARFAGAGAARFRGQAGLQVPRCQRVRMCQQSGKRRLTRERGRNKPGYGRVAGPSRRVGDKKGLGDEELQEAEAEVCLLQEGPPAEVYSLSLAPSEVAEDDTPGKSAL